TVIDLHDPRRPTARGELQMPGFSSYLHPLSDSVLLGVGMGPGEQGGQGLQLSLFDVGNPDRPARIANRVLDHAWSPAQHDHHAFLWWPATNQLVLPYDQYAEGAQRTGALVIPVDLKTGFGTQSDIHHFGRTVDRSEQIQRALVADGRLLTLSQAGLLTSDLASLKERAWLAW
ncbi:MAG TPA: beta-propeller domain-containing protein, partial [Acidimicrobiales bacterium]|nr:beta-propeller domain-containing protein [Acidimicrobiales bacterium]